MFGMNDPAQTLMQLENYIKDGRLEMSEVMATQFTDMLLNIKKRSEDDQVMLVRGLQMLCDVLIIRSKYNLAVTASKTLLRERKKLSQSSTVAGFYYQDIQRSAKCFALYGKTRKAKSLFVKAFKQSGGCIACALDGLILIPTDRKISELLIDSLTEVESVIKSGQQYILQPENLPPVEVNSILDALKLTIFRNNTKAELLHQKFSQQINAIQRGEMAANQKLQNALNSLQPKHDYYEYS